MVADRGGDCLGSFSLDNLLVQLFLSPIKESVTSMIPPRFRIVVTVALRLESWAERIQDISGASFAIAASQSRTEKLFK